MIRVILVDDHEIVRRGLRGYLDTEEDIQVVGEAGDGGAAVDLAATTPADVILMDLIMPGVDGVEATRRILAEHSETRVLVLTSFTGDEQITEALSAGATGYLLKTARAEDVAQAIRDTAAGRPTVAPEVLRRMVERMKQGNRPPSQTGAAPAAAREWRESPEPAPAAGGAAQGFTGAVGTPTGPDGEALTPRELEVLALIGDGLTNQEIADQLIIGIRTVKTHVSNLLAKLQLSDRTQLAVYANRQGLTGR